MTTRKKTCLILLALVVLCGALLAWLFTGGTQLFYRVNGSLSSALTKYGIKGAVDITMGEWETVNVETRSGSFVTEARTVSHGNIYTAYADLPLNGDFYAGDTIIVYFEARNTGASDTNFLVDLHARDSKVSYLTRTPIFSPTKSPMPCWFYGIVSEDTDTALFELTLGWAAQSVEITNVKAAVYPGTVREVLLEQLPNMSHSGRSRTLWPDWSTGDAKWREDAARMIAENRTGEITVQVVDESGMPVENASVTVLQTGHDYILGTAGGRRWVGDTIKDYFNTVTIANDLKWERGEVLESAYDALVAYKEQGLQVHGHVLFWPATDRDPYDDGVDHTSEFVTTPGYIVSYVHVIQAMQKMNDPNTGYGDGTVKTLRAELSAAVMQFESDLSSYTDEMTIRHLTQMRDICNELSAAISGMADEETGLMGVKPELTDFQTLLRQIVIEHTEHFASYYGNSGAIVEWDTFNEVFNLGNRGVINALGEDQGTYDGVSVATDGGAYENQILVDVLNAADRGSGGLPLSYNDVSWQANVRQREWTYAFLTWLKSQNAPISFMGLQAYMNPMNIRAFMSPEETWQQYDKLLELGIQTEVTEYGFSGFDALALSPQQAEQVKADFLHDYILMNYAHPGSRGFISWGGIPASGPVSSAYYKLVYSDLWTNETVTTDDEGIAEVRGYLGSYEIKVREESGKEKTIVLDALSTDGQVVRVVVGE